MRDWCGTCRTHNTIELDPVPDAFTKDMENIFSIGAGVALRVVLDVATGKDHKLIGLSIAVFVFLSISNLSSMRPGILIGLWEGVVLSHFLSKHTRSRSRSRSKDPYLALATRMAIDIYLSYSISRFALTCAWTLVGLLLADVAPRIWRDTGLKSVYKALRREVRAIMKAIPRWKVKNDLRAPRISIKYPVRSLFTRASPSSVVSSTRAAPPASPSQQIHKRRMPPGTYPGRPALSETSSELSRVREVIPGPSPAFISTTVDPACLPPVDLHSQHISHLSDAGPSKSDPITIHEDSWVHVSVSSHSPEQGQDPDLSALDIPPLAPEGQTVTANVEVLSPKPRMHINSLPTIAARQVPLPESRPASVIGSVLSLFGAKSILSRPRGDKIKLDVGIDATQHQASTTDWERPTTGQEEYQPSAVTGHRRMNSGPGSSMLRHADDDDESVVGKGARTEPLFGGRPESLLGTGGEAFVGGFSADVMASEAFVGGFAVECTENVFATQSGIASQPLFASGQSDVPSQNPPMNSSQTPTPPDAPTTRSTITGPQPPDWVPPSNTDSISGANINTAADNPLSNPISNADDPASKQNPTLSAAPKPEKLGKKKKSLKNAMQTASQGAPSGLPETTPQGQQQTSSRAQTPGPDSQNPAGSASDPTLHGPTQDAAVPVQRTTEIDTNTTKHGHTRGVQGPDFPDSSPNSPPPPFKEVATPIEPTLLTPEQTERESMRGEFLMRELKQLEMLIAKAESGTGRGSPSAMSVERLNGLKERFGMVRGRVERRVYGGASLIIFSALGTVLNLFMHRSLHRN